MIPNEFEVNRKELKSKFHALVELGYDFKVESLGDNINNAYPGLIRVNSPEYRITILDNEVKK